MRVEQVRAFLDQDEIKLLIEDEDLEAVYAKCDKDERKDLTEYLLSIGIQPDEYMKNIPSDFLSTSQISSYDISSRVSVVGNTAFSYCTSLTSITIPDSVTKIGYGAFWGCNSLQSVTMGKGVTSIGGDAFWDCDNIEIYYNGTQQQWEKIARAESFTHTYYIAHCIDGDIAKRRK